jgi:phospholipid-binding lipoprotein MlaA
MNSRPLPSRPDRAPAARGWRLLAALLMAGGALAGCATVPATAGQDPRDPLERANRQVFEFNQAIDRTAIRPLAQAYVDYVPDPVRECVNNAFSNLREPSNAVNNLLQGKPSEAAQSAVRLIMNSTFGLAGCFDVVGDTGVPRHPEDFGQTLGVWGFGDGPYLVLPLLGPSSVRDTTGLGVETVLDPNFYIGVPSIEYSLFAARVFNQRANLLPADALLDTALDRYLAVRDAYLQRRRNLVYDGFPPMELDPDMAPEPPAGEGSSDPPRTAPTR